MSASPYRYADYGLVYIIFAKSSFPKKSDVNREYIPIPSHNYMI